LVGVGVLIQWLNERGVELSVTGSNPSFRRAAAYTGAGAVALVLLGLPNVQGLLGARGGEVVASLQESRFNRLDEELLERGYYEGLLETNKFTSQLWEVVQKQPQDWIPIGDTKAARRTNKLLRYELEPSMQLVFHRAPMSTNRWGMRDRDYEKAKPANTYRIALLGKSYEMGGGAKDGETFEAVAEARLNAELAGKPYDRYEILNFAVGGYTLLDLVIVTREKVFDFEPDAVFYTAHSVEERILFNRLSRVIMEGKPLPPDLEALVKEAGVETGMSQAEARRMLAPYSDALIAWGYRAIVEACRERGVLPVWVFVPRTDDEGEAYQAERERLRRLAEEAGFVLLDLDGAYGDVDRRVIQLAPWDKHANAEGQKMLGDRLFEEIRRHASELGLAEPAMVGAHAEN